LARRRRGTVVLLRHPYTPFLGGKKNRPTPRLRPRIKKKEENFFPVLGMKSVGALSYICFCRRRKKSISLTVQAGKKKIYRYHRKGALALRQIGYLFYFKEKKRTWIFELQTKSKRGKHIYLQRKGGNSRRTPRDLLAFT